MPTIHIRLYNPNQQHYAKSIAQHLTQAGYDVADIEHAAELRSFAAVEVEPAAGVATSDLLETLRLANVIPVRTLAENPDAPADTIRLNVSNV